MNFDLVATWIPLVDQNTWWTTIVLFFIGYLFGTFLLFRIRITLFNKGSTTLRSHYSKELFTPSSFGTSNAARAYGVKFAILNFFTDFSKVILFWFAVALPLTFYCPLFNRSLMYLGLIGVLVGHNFPIWWKFKGGDGVVASLAIIYLFNWLAATIGLLFYIFSSLYITKNGVPTTFWAIIITLSLNSIPIFYTNSVLTFWYAIDQFYYIWFFWFIPVIVSLAQIISARSFKKWFGFIIFKYRDKKITNY